MSTAPVIPMWFHAVELLVALSITLKLGESNARATICVYALANFWIVVLDFLGRRGSINIDRFGLIYQLVSVACECVALTVIMLRSDKHWTMLVASISYVEFATAAINYTSPTSLWAYATFQLIWYYLMLATVLGAVWWERRRKSSPAPG